MRKVRKKPFEASRLKIERAEQHIAALENALNEYLARSPIKISEFTKDDQLYRQIDASEKLPIGLSAIIGDVVHNLRTSLDLLACELVRMNGGDDTNVYFPFAKDATELERQIRRRGIDRAAPEFVDLVRSLKPYGNGNRALRGVHDLDIIDKHRTLLPAFAGLELPGLAGPHSGFGQVSGSFSSASIIPERLRSLSKEERLRFTLKVVFHKSLPFAHDELVSTLRGLAAEFGRTIDAFEALCPD